MAGKKTPADFAVLLQIRADLDAKKQRGAIDTRLVGLGLGDECSRCGGSGNYSYNMMDGTRCFKCLGARKIAPKLTNKLYAQIEALVADGTLDAYFNALRAKAERRKAIAGATDEYFALWKGIGLDYDWMRASQKIEPHRTISKQFNEPMANFHKTLQDACSAFDSAEFRVKKAETSEARDQAEAQLLEAGNRVVAVRAEGKALAERIKGEYEAYKETLETSNG